MPMARHWVWLALISRGTASSFGVVHKWYAAITAPSV